MIDIERAKRTFKEYVKNYNPEDCRIKLKITHIERTSQVSKIIAKKLQLENDDIQLAELIGLLHDIGRFEQIRRYHTFIDKDSINHGVCGVQVLFDDGLIKDFVEDRQYDNIIKIAILNHNTSQIESGLDDRTMLHCKILRDADKTDIFYTLTFEDVRPIYNKDNFEEDHISDEIFNQFIQKRKINYSNIQTSADILVANFAYLYDFNYKYGLKRIYEEGYIDKLYNRFRFSDSTTMERYNKIYEISKKEVKEVLQTEGNEIKYI